MSKRALTYFLYLLPLFVFSSCQFRPLEEMSNTHYLRVYLDERIINLTEGFYNENYLRPAYSTPEVLHAVLADPATGDVVAERYLRNHGEDAYGHYLDGYVICEPGEWNLLVWNFDTETTQVRNERKVFDAMGYTNEIASHLRAGLTNSRSKTDEPERIVYDPDPLLVAQDRVILPYTDEIDTLKASNGGRFVAQCITQTWYLQVKVKGMKFVTSARSLISGMAGSKWLWNPRMNEEDPVTLYFDMNQGDRNDSDDTDIVYATFSTFGRLPGATNNLQVTFDFVTTYGTNYCETLDISQKFDEEDALKHQWILLDKDVVIEIPEPPKIGGGGFNPGVGEWDDIETDLII